MVHRAPEIVLQIDQAVVSRLAKEKAWYSVETAGPDGVLGTSDDQPVAISKVAYRAGSHTIKLAIPRNAAAAGDALLTVVARGIVNPFGQELEGDGLASGVNFVRQIDLP